MPSIMQEKHIGKPCQCGIGTFQEPKNGQEWHVSCSECSAILFCYEPMPHQARFHADTAKFSMYAGGYG